MLDAALSAAGFVVTAVPAGSPLPLDATPPPHMVVLDTGRRGEREALADCQAVRRRRQAPTRRCCC